MYIGHVYIQTPTRSSISPDVQLDYEPWGHMDHSDGHCSWQSSDRTAAYVHKLALMSRDLGVPSSDGGGDMGGTSAKTTPSSGGKTSIEGEPWEVWAMVLAPSTGTGGALTGEGVVIHEHTPLGWGTFFTS